MTDQTKEVSNIVNIIEALKASGVIPTAAAAAKAGAAASFDFKAFNDLTNYIPASLKVALASNLIDGAMYDFERFNNPLKVDLSGIGSELKTFRIKLKADSEARRKEREGKVAS